MYIYTECPTCSDENKHQVIKESQSTALVKCDECGTIHQVEMDRKRPISVRIVVSVDDLSFKSKMEFHPEDLVSVGDEFIVESEDDASAVEVTSVELSSGKRVSSANAGEIETIWSRLTDFVVINVSLHKNRRTKAIRIKAPGDYKFIVGESESVEFQDFEISSIKLRDGKVLKTNGDDAAAKKIKRIYGRPIKNRSENF
ncbi:MAG: HVO_0476 family zinc finger protein [Halobacteriota archaeon]|nr:HVO_0476 family zinc finger protein [Halobacteriota archaeon]